MGRRYRLYLETSFWKRLGDPAYPVRRKMTYRFLRRAGKRHAFLLSRLVLGEIQRTPDLQERRLILRRIWSVHPQMVTANRKAERIALDLLDAGRWAEGAFADMLHIGYSILGGADALLTWDKDDLACVHTRRVLQAYGRRKGISVPLIGMPEEVAEWLNIRIR